MTSPYPVTVTNFPPSAPVPLQPWFHWTQPDVTLVAAVLATAGWLWTTHRNRVAARKQHTISVIMANETNEKFREAEQLIAPYLVAASPVDLAAVPLQHAQAFQLVLNRYEFIAAGIKGQDFDEPLVIKTLRTTILEMWEITADAVRAKRVRVSAPRMYRELEWLHDRWKDRAGRKWWEY